MLQKIYYHIIDRWWDNPRLSHLGYPDPKVLNVALSHVGTSCAKIVRFSWIVRRQRIDLSQIVEIRQRDISIVAHRHVSLFLDVIMLRDKSGMIHIVEITDFRDKDKEEILNLIQMNPNALYGEDVKSINIPKPVVRQNKRQKKETELVAQEEQRKALQAERKKQLNEHLKEQVRISKEAGKYSVILTEVGSYSDGIIALIMEITGKSEQDAQKGIENLPYLVITGIERDEAMSLADRLLATDRCARIAIK